MSANVADIETAQKVCTALQTLGQLASYERPPVVAEEAFRASGLLDALLASSNRERPRSAR